MQQPSPSEFQGQNIQPVSIEALNNNGVAQKVLLALKNIGVSLMSLLISDEEARLTRRGSVNSKEWY